MPLIPLGKPAAPTNITIMATTADSVTLTWLAGLNGGHQQSFLVMQGSPEMDGYMSSYPKGSIHDPGQGKLVQHTLTGLQPETRYDFIVMATNDKGITASAHVTTVTLGK